MQHFDCSFNEPIHDEEEQKSQDCNEENADAKSLNKEEE